MRREENKRVPGEKPSEQGENANVCHRPELIEPGPHWWEASALSTAPYLHHFQTQLNARTRIGSIEESSVVYFAFAAWIKEGRGLKEGSVENKEELV